MSKTLVRFYNEGFPRPQTLAVFPQHKSWNGYGEVNMIYSHIGQHSTAHKEYFKDLPIAKKEDYADLLNELTQQGYELKVLNKL